MGYDLHVEIPGDWPKGLRVRSLRNDNFTWNINALLKPTKWVGLTLRHLDGMPVWDAGQVLDEVYLEWGEKPRFFQQFEVVSWGKLSDCSAFVQGLAAELFLEYDETALLRVS